jgi:hypothetical protein
MVAPTTTYRTWKRLAERPGGTPGLPVYHRRDGVGGARSVIDRAGTEVVHADITCWVTPA